MPKNQHTYNRKIKTSSLSLPIHQNIYAQKNISPYFFCRFTDSLHTCDGRFFNTPSLLQRNSEALLPPKFLTFYKLFTNEEETPLTFTADSEALWANIFSLFYFCFSQRKKSPSLSMGLQKHFDHLKIVLFTNCLHSNPHTIERRQSWKLPHLDNLEEQKGGFI